MRILQVIEFFSPSMGGSAQVAYQTARHLARRGHQVSVWSSDYGADGSRFPDGPFETVLFRCPVARWGFYPTPGLVRWARRHAGEFDVVHLHNLRTFQNLVMAGAARREGVPYVLSAHGSLPQDIGHGFAKRAFDLLFARRLLDGARRLVAVSPLEVTQYRQAGVAGEWIALVPNGLDLDEFSSLPARGAFRQRMSLGDRKKLLLFLGRLDPIKEVDRLIEAFARLSREGTGAWLVVAGPDDGELAPLQALAGELGLRDSVRFTGPLYGEDKLSCYVDADLVAAPGAYEIFGLVPFEALLCGTPVVVGQGSGVGQLLGQAGAAYLVPPGNVEVLADALRRALAGGPGARARVAAGQALVRREFDWAAIAGRLEELYAVLI